MTHIAWVRPSGTRPRGRRSRNGRAPSVARGRARPGRRGRGRPRRARPGGRVLTPGERRHVAAEIVEHLLGCRVGAGLRDIVPLLISGLPVFCRWRGRPDFGERQFEELTGLADRLVIDSREWDDPAADYARLAELFERVAVSDIAWRRTCRGRLRWRATGQRSGAYRAGSEGPGRRRASPSRLAALAARRGVRLALEPSDDVESVAVDGRAQQPPAEPLSASDLLSAELETFGRDRVYEAAVTAARRE